MKEVCVYIKLDEYLAQWFIHEQGGSHPVKLLRNSIENAMLEHYLQKLPEGQTPNLNIEGKVAILIPEYRYKDADSFNYLPPMAEQAIKRCIQNRFDICMWNSIHKFSSIFHRKDELIYAFMEKHGIELSGKNWDAIAKRYQRKRDYYLMNKSRKKNRKK